MLRAEVSDEIQVLRAANGGHLGAERAGDLYGESTDSTGCSIHEHPPASQGFVAVVRKVSQRPAQSLYRRERRQWYGCRLLEREVVRHVRRRILADYRILGVATEYAVQHRVNVISGLETFHLGAYGNDLTGNVPAWDASPLESGDRP